MDYDNDFFIQVQGVIERVFRAERQEILDSHGRIKIDLKDDATVVTELDKQMESKLREELIKFDSAIGIEGEEFGVEGSRETFWLLDPIDGTEAFTRGLPFFRNMATLIDHGTPIFALVYKPVSDELYVAAEGEGTFRNGTPVSVSTRPLSRARVELSTLLDDPSVWPFVSKLASSINSIRTADEFLFVVEGKFDGHIVYKSDTKPWDNAPRALLMQEAGARVANLGTDSYDYRNSDMLAAPPGIFDDLMDIFISTIKK